MGQNAEGMVFDKGVEVRGLGIDAGTFDLQVDEEVCPQVVAHFGVVLAVEDSHEGVVGIGFVGCVVADVETYLGAQGVVE